MSKFSHFFAILLLSLVLAACGSLPKIPTEVAKKWSKCAKIETGPGPEDFAVEYESPPSRKPAPTSPKPKQIWISSHDRRNWKNPGEIYILTPGGTDTQKVPRIGEPADLSFRPHGIDIRYLPDGTRQLYIILHGSTQAGPPQSIAVYKITNTGLSFLREYRHKLLVSPNDISVQTDGSFYVTNDSRERGNRWDIIWGREVSNIVFFRNREGQSNNNWMVAADSLAMANGILALEKDVFATATRQNAVFRMRKQADGSLSYPVRVAKIPGPDNLHYTLLTSRENESQKPVLRLWTTSHPSSWAFFRHTSSPTNYSPSVVWQIDLESGRNPRAMPVFSDSGEKISAASTATRIGNQLLISQVFESHLLSCQ